jgi:urease accessory protein UreH
MCGRHGRGERWMFATLVHHFTVTRDGVLEYLERYRVEPARRDVTRSWVAGRATYFGTTLASGSEVESELPEQLQADLEAIGGIRPGVARLDARLLLVRLMGWSGPSFHAARIRTRDALLGSRAQTDAHERECVSTSRRSS